MRNHTLVAAISAGILAIGVAACQQADGASAVAEVAHRGYLGNGAPESSYTSVRHAIQKGFAGVEFDARLTEDRRAVLMHDTTLDRTTDCAGPVSTHTLAEIQECSLDGGGRVPTLLGMMQYVDRLSASEDWDGVVFVHVKVKLDSHAAAGFVKAAREVTDGERRVIFLLENPSDAAPLRGAGWDGFHAGVANNDMPHVPGVLSNPHNVERLGFVVHTTEDWGLTGFAQVVLTYGFDAPGYDARITPARAARVHAEGSLLLGVEGFPQTSEELLNSGADGVFR